MCLVSLWLESENPLARWLEILEEMTVNREQCHSFCYFLWNQNNWKNTFVQLDCVACIGYCSILIFPAYVDPLPSPGIFNLVTEDVTVGKMHPSSRFALVFNAKQ